MADNEREEEVQRAVGIVNKAAELQADTKRHMVPRDNFFPNMLGFIAQTQGADVAEAIYNVFEMAALDHSEMLDDMMRNPEDLKSALKEVFENPDNWK